MSEKQHQPRIAYNELKETVLATTSASKERRAEEKKLRTRVAEIATLWRRLLTVDYVRERVTEAMRLGYYETKLCEHYHVAKARDNEIAFADVLDYRAPGEEEEEEESLRDTLEAMCDDWPQAVRLYTDTNGDKERFGTTLWLNWYPLYLSLGPLVLISDRPCAFVWVFFVALALLCIGVGRWGSAVSLLVSFVVFNFFRLIPTPLTPSIEVKWHTTGERADL